MLKQEHKLKFSRGDLIVDRNCDDMGILVKKSKIIFTIPIEHNENITQATTRWGWEIMWIRQDKDTDSKGPFKHLERILSEDFLYKGFCKGTMDYYPVGSDEYYDMEIGSYITGKDKLIE
tara:strand:+ start:6741 stop:7100 length:360 start_codon:yes stop_codon:yes gene_type:complete